MGKLIISVFYDVDNFCKELKAYFEHFRLSCEKETISFEPSSVYIWDNVMRRERL